MLTLSSTHDDRPSVSSASSRHGAKRRGGLYLYNGILRHVYSFVLLTDHRFLHLSYPFHLKYEQMRREYTTNHFKTSRPIVSISSICPYTVHTHHKVNLLFCCLPNSDIASRPKASRHWKVIAKRKWDEFQRNAIARLIKRQKTIRFRLSDRCEKHSILTLWLVKWEKSNHTTRGKDCRLIQGWDQSLLAGAKVCPSTAVRRVTRRASGHLRPPPRTSAPRHLRTCPFLRKLPSRT